MKEEYLVYWQAAQDIPEIRECKGRGAQNGGRVWHSVSQSFDTEQAATARYEEILADPAAHGVYLVYRKFLRDWKDDRMIGLALPILGRVGSVAGNVLHVDNANVFYDDQSLKVFRDGSWVGEVRICSVDSLHGNLHLFDVVPAGVRSGDLLAVA